MQTPEIGTQVTLTDGTTATVTGHYQKFPWLVAVKTTDGRVGTVKITEIA